MSIVLRDVGKRFGKEHSEGNGVKLVKRSESCDDRYEIIRKLLFAGYAERIDGAMAV